MSIVTSVDVCDAIGATLVKLWPDRFLYRDACPADHQRPSGYLYVTKSRVIPETPWLGQWEMEAQLELFCATDEYDLSSTEELRRDQEKVLLAFAAPKIHVNDRWITLMARGEGMEAGSAFVVFSASWMDDLPGTVDPDAPGDPEGAKIPRMEHFEINQGSAATGGGTPEVQIEEEIR